MNKLTYPQKLRISLYCAQYCMDLFVRLFFLSEKDRGPNFKWSNFPDNISGLCSSQVFMLYPDNFPALEAAKKYAKRLSKKMAQEMIKHEEFKDK